MKEIDHYKKLLLDEKSTLEKELPGIGRKNPDDVGDWQAKSTNRPEESADEADVAEELQQFETNSAVVENLEVRLNEVKSALQKIEEGKYGICEICGKEIEEDRLEANPAAKTCKEHMN